MHTNYQPLKQVSTDDYMPGFPTRAYEFGTYPYNNKYEVPGLSTFHHDLMPYYYCCRFASSRCQLFYWRRPTSGCQEYRPPVVGVDVCERTHMHTAAAGGVAGGGHVHTMSNSTIMPTPVTLVHPGVYSLVRTAKVTIQVRVERFPSRLVNFGRLSVS
jgi:hypothetical protein